MRESRGSTGGGGETDLASGTLAYETGTVLSKAVVVEAETFDVGMRRHAGLALALRDTGSHDGARGWRKREVCLCNGRSWSGRGEASLVWQFTRQLWLGLELAR